MLHTPWLSLGSTYRRTDRTVKVVHFIAFATGFTWFTVRVTGFTCNRFSHIEKLELWEMHHLRAGWLMEGNGTKKISSCEWWSDVKCFYLESKLKYTIICGRVASLIFANFDRDAPFAMLQWYVLYHCFFYTVLCNERLKPSKFTKSFCECFGAEILLHSTVFLSPHSRYEFTPSHSTFHSSVFNPVRKSNWILESWSLKDRGPSVTAGSFSSTDPGYAEKKMEPYEALTVTRVKLQGQGSKDSKNA